MKPTLLRMREGKEGGGKGPLLSEDVSLTLTGVQDVLFTDSPTSAPSAASEDSTSASKGLDGRPWRSARSIPTPPPSSPTTGPTFPTSETSWSLRTAQQGANGIGVQEELTPALDQTKGPAIVTGKGVMPHGSPPLSGVGASRDRAKTSPSPESGEDSGSTTAFSAINALVTGDQTQAMVGGRLNTMPMVAKVIRMSGDYADPHVMVDDLPMLAANPMSDRQMTVVTGLTMEPDPASPSPSSTSYEQLSLMEEGLSSFSSKTSQGSSVATLALTSSPSSVRWQTAGSAWLGGFSTHAGSPSPNVGNESSSSECECVVTTLTDILQPTAPPRYSLSPRACAGILSRAARRGRSLPPHLEQALRSQADSPDDTERVSTPPLTTEPSSSVRRLTPVECERLMSLPDGWTIAPEWRSTSRRKAAKEPTSPPTKSSKRLPSPPPSTSGPQTEE